MNESSKIALFDNVAARVLIWILALTPLFFIPYLGISQDVLKTYLVFFGALVLLCLWIITRMTDGSISHPKSPTVFAILLIPVVYLISALFSPVPAVSFGGIFLPVGTVFTITTLVIIFFATVFYIKTEDKVKTFFKSLAVTFFIVSFLEILHLVFGSKITLGVLYSSTTHILGNLNDMGIYYGGAAIAALAAVEFLSLKKMSKILVTIILVISLFFLALVNFMTAWILLGVFSLIIFVYALTILRQEATEKRYHFPLLPFITLLVTLLFVLANGAIGGWLPRMFGISQTDVRPSIQTTAHVVYQTLKQHPLTGVGPDRFNSAWLLNQPKEIVMTPFWNTPFNSGFGFLLTVPIVTGLLGILAFLAFMILFILSGILHAFSIGRHSSIQFSMFTSFLLSCYGWTLICIYNPGIVLFALTFAFSGIFLGLLVTTGSIPLKTYNFLDDPRKSFFSILFLVLVLLGSLSLVFIGGKKFTSLVLYSRASSALSKNDVAGAGQLLSQAISFQPSDIYYQGMVTLDLNQLNTLIQDTKLSQDTIKSGFKNIFSVTENDARAAINYDRSNPENWITLGSVYSGVLPLGVTGAYENAKAAYEVARKLIPNSPRIDLLQASLEFSNKNTDGARSLIADALKKKSNLSDAYILLAEIDLASNLQQAAISNLEKAAQVDQGNANIVFQLGLLKYKNYDYVGAISAFEQASILDITSLASRFYLGLAYEKAGRIEDESTLFHALAKQLPKNDQLQKVVANLDSGKNALDGMISSDQSSLTQKPDPKSASTVLAPNTTLQGSDKKK